MLGNLESVERRNLEEVAGKLRPEGFMSGGRKETSSLSLQMSSQSFLEPGDHYQMKNSLESKLLVLVRKIASSGVYYLILMWLLRIVVFVLWVGKCVLIWLLTFSFLLVRECTQRYLSVALLQLTLTPPSTREDGTKRAEEEGGLAERGEERLDVARNTSPLLPAVVKDRVKICEENLCLEDRFGPNSSETK